MRAQLASSRDVQVRLQDEIDALRSRLRALDQAVPDVTYELLPAPRTDTATAAVTSLRTPVTATSSAATAAAAERLTVSQSHDVTVTDVTSCSIKSSSSSSISNGNADDTTVHGGGSLIAAASDDVSTQENTDTRSRDAGSTAGDRTPTRDVDASHVTAAAAASRGSKKHPVNTDNDASDTAHQQSHVTVDHTVRASSLT